MASKNTLLPWHASYLKGNWTAAAQCMTGGDDGWSASQTAWNGGSNNHWPWNSPYSMAYFDRADIPTHFQIAEAYTVADMYQVSELSYGGFLGDVVDVNFRNQLCRRLILIGFTCYLVLRVFLMGPNKPVRVVRYCSIRIIHLVRTLSLYPENSQSDTKQIGCHHNYPNTDCWPLGWNPIMKYLEDAGVTWQVYQTNPWPSPYGGREILSGFQYFNVSTPGSPVVSIKSFIGVVCELLYNSYHFDLCPYWLARQQERTNFV
jgi:phospholipase C